MGARLEEAVWIGMFAGYGGTGNLAYETIRFILKDPRKWGDLFTQDKAAFMLEAARLFPPVGGMNPFAFREPRTITFPEKLGRPPKEISKDFIAMTSTSGANRDPTVYEDPLAFKPGRKNALKVLTWNNEIGEIRKCKTVAGCPEAPRGCPGTHLSLRVATRVVESFVDGLSYQASKK